MITPCLSHRENTGQTFRGYIFADSGGDELVPADDSENGLSSGLTSQLNYQIIDNKIKVDFNEALVYHTGTGPYYDWDRKWGASSSCSNAPFSSYHFRFAKPPVCLMERDSYDIRPLNELSPP